MLVSSSTSGRFFGVDGGFVFDVVAEQRLDLVVGDVLRLGHGHGDEDAAGRAAGAEEPVRAGHRQSALHVQERLGQHEGQGPVERRHKRRGQGWFVDRSPSPTKKNILLRQVIT